MSDNYKIGPAPLCIHSNPILFCDKCEIEKRICKLETYKNCQIDENRKISASFDKINGYIKMEDRVTAIDVLARLIELEDFNKRQIDWNNHIVEWMSKIENKLDDSGKFPHKCPVCIGYGSELIKSDNVADGPMKYYREHYPCHTCKGNGIVWG